MTRIHDVDLAAIDVETTGLYAAGGDRVIEVAVVRGRLDDAAPTRWSTLVHPGRAVGASHIHGLADVDLAGAPPFAAVVDPLAERLRGAVLVAHNARFDLGFLELEHRLCGRAAPSAPVIDTLGLSRRHLALDSHALAALCARFAIEAPSHRALADAEATWHLARLLLRALDPERRWTVDEAVAACRRRTPEEQRALSRRLQEALRADRPVWVDYHSADRAEPGGVRRCISVRHVTTRRVVAWCHLRGAERTFRLDRLRLVEEQGP